MEGRREREGGGLLRCETDARSLRGRGGRREMDMGKDPERSSDRHLRFPTEY